MTNPELNYYPTDITPINGPSGSPLPNNPLIPTGENNIVPGTNGVIMAGGAMQSPNFSKGVSGWIIRADGSVEFGTGVFRGDITGASGTFTGTITATTGSIGGFDIGADYIRDAANSFGLASTVTGSDDVRFWAGNTFANRAQAPFRVTEAGAVTATSITVTTPTSSFIQVPLTFNFTAGEAISIRDAVSISDGTITADAVSQVSNNLNANPGMSTDQGDTGGGDLKGISVGQSFTVPYTLTLSSVIVKVGRITSDPGDSLKIAIQADSAGSPSGVDLGSATKLWTALNGTPQEETFSIALTLTVATTYWIVASRTGGTSATEYYLLRYEGSNAYANGRLKINFNTGGWLPPSAGATESDLYFKIVEAIDSGEIVRSSSAAANSRNNNFIGFATAAIAIGASGTITMEGLATLTGLTAGARYYLADAAGAIGTSAGSQTRKVGIAATTTQLLITNIW